MGIILDPEQATRIFGQALTLAHTSGTSFPLEWIEMTRNVSKARHKTFTPVLGTALLARATDADVDVLALRAGESDVSYSARNLAHGILVPACANAGVDLRNKGVEPLNNQPFLKAPRISREMLVPKHTQTDLDYLCDCLERVQVLAPKDALHGLSAFLRVRMDASPPLSTIRGRPASLSTLLEAVAATAKTSGSHEMAVALAVTALKTIYADVRAAQRPTGSRPETPGQIGCYAHKTQVLAAEVWLGAVTEEEILAFAERLKAGHVERGAVFLMDGSTIDPEQAQFHARRLHRVELLISTGAEGLLRTLVLLAPKPLPGVVASFADAVLAEFNALSGSSEARNALIAAFERAAKRQED